MQNDSQDSQKLYRKIALAIAAAISDGRYSPGDKLPSERELADEFHVSRPTIRDAMIALEFQGLVEARQGSGVYVTAAVPVREDPTELEVNALEWTEARRLFEGEACALSAAVVTPEQLTSLEHQVNEMAASTSDEETERLEREFHMAIALATGNAAIAVGAEELWLLASNRSPAYRCYDGRALPAAILSRSIARSWRLCASTTPRPHGMRSTITSLEWSTTS